MSDIGDVTRLKVIQAIREEADAEGFANTNSYRIAAKLGCHQNHIQYIVKRLKDDGVVELIKLPTKSHPGTLRIEMPGRGKPIESVTRYVPNRNYSGYGAPSFVAVSLPRLKCLESSP